MSNMDYDLTAQLYVLGWQAQIVMAGLIAEGWTPGVADDELADAQVWQLQAWRDAFERGERLTIDDLLYDTFKGEPINPEVLEHRRTAWLRVIVDCAGRMEDLHWHDCPEDYCGCGGRWYRPDPGTRTFAECQECRRKDP
jgi:hypothetical protein